MGLDFSICAVPLMWSVVLNFGGSQSGDQEMVVILNILAKECMWDTMSTHIYIYSGSNKCSCYSLDFSRLNSRTLELSQESGALGSAYVLPPC